MDLKVDLAKILDDLGKRVYRVEQTVTSPSVMGTGGDGGNEFDHIYIGPELIDAVAPDAPTGITVTPGVNFGEIYADVEWVAPANGKAQSYYVELTKLIAVGPPEEFSLERVTTTVGTNYRFDNLEPNTTYSVRVQGISKIGIIGDWAVSAQFTTGIDTTIPSQVTGVVAGRGATSLVVTYDRSPDPDVDRGNGLYEIWISNNNTFNGTYLHKEYSSATVVAFTDIVDQGTMYVQVRAIDQSGNAGPWSTTVASTAGGVIDSMIVAGLSAAKITFGTMSGDRITTNTLLVNKIVSSTLTSTTITMGSGGTIAIGSPPTSGVYINNLGIRGYKSGSETFILDNSGNATFKGNISSATMTGSSAVFGGVTLNTSGMIVSTTPLNSYSSPYAIRFLSGTSERARIWTFGDFVGALLYMEALGSNSVIYSHADQHRFANQSGATTFFSTTSTQFVVNVTTTNVQNLNVMGTGGIFCSAASTIGNVDLLNGRVVTSSSALCSVGGVTLQSGSMGVGGITSGTTYSTAVSGRSVIVNSNGFFGTTSSTLRMKKDIQKVSDQRLLGLSKKMLDLDLVSFFYKSDKHKEEEQFGAIAEWVEETLGDQAHWFIAYDHEGRPDAVKYELLSLALFPLIKKMSEQLETLQGRA